MQDIDRCGLYVADIRVDDMREVESGGGVLVDRDPIALNKDRGRSVRRRFETDRNRHHRWRVDK